MERKTKSVIALIVALVVVSPFIAHAVPQAVGADRSFIVESGSMEPAIGTGSVIWVQETAPEKIDEGDVVTFVADRRGNTVTHRVVDKTERNGNTYFATKGDANEERDSESVRGENVLGKVIFTIPLLGYVIAFLSSDIGLVLFIVIPAVLLAIDGLWDLYQSIAEDG